MFFLIAEKVPPLHTPVASAVQAGGEGWAVDQSKSYPGKVSPKESKESRSLVSCVEMN